MKKTGCMLRKKGMIKITLIIVCAVVLLITVYFVIFLHWADTTELDIVSQTHFDFVVKEGQVVDYNAFINPQGETSALSHIDKSIRLQIADYMRKNNLKLQTGHHYIRKKVTSNSEDIGTLEEHIKYLKFTHCQ